MKLSELKTMNLNKKRSKRVGRGESSGKGKTSGRGMKGQRARGSVKTEFEGGQLPIIKRLPFKRGVGNTSLVRKRAITLDQLEKFEKGSTVDVEFLRKNNLIPKGKRLSVKVVASGEITKPLIVKLRVSKKAKILIEKVKGKVEDNA
ncbi:MAG: 50S ribosomal protein L15 [Candidatus Woykebacteria bacterium]